MIKNKIHIFSAFFIFLTISGYSQAITQVIPISFIEAAQKNRNLPKLNTDTTITGPDLNKNGIRDDIEIIIKVLVPETNKQKAVFQSARSYQASLLLDLNNKNEINKI